MKARIELANLRTGLTTVQDVASPPDALILAMNAVRDLVIGDPAVTQKLVERVMGMPPSPSAQAVVSLLEPRDEGLYNVHRFAVVTPQVVQFDVSDAHARDHLGAILIGCKWSDPTQTSLELGEQSPEGGA